ncbi:MAG: hypothetical protein ACYTKD_13850, partial [Planctomycetota bacterium]
MYRLILAFTIIALLTSTACVGKAARPEASEAVQPHEQKALELLSQFQKEAEAAARLRDRQAVQAKARKPIENADVGKKAAYIMDLPEEELVRLVPEQCADIQAACPVCRKHMRFMKKKWVWSYFDCNRFSSGKVGRRVVSGGAVPVVYAGFDCAPEDLRDR